MLKVICFFSKKKNPQNEILGSSIDKNIKRLFWGFFILGIGFIIAMPPMQNADERAHFYRAYEISQGIFVHSVEGASLPISIIKLGDTLHGNLPFHPENKIEYKTILSQFAIDLEPEKNKMIHFHYSTYYFPPVAYLPQAVLIAIGRVFELSPIMIFYLGRLGNLVICGFLFLFALRILPCCKIGVLLITLVPMNISRVASNSADGMLNALSVLFIAFCLRYLLDTTKPLNYRNILNISLIGIGLSFCKLVYMPLLFVGWLIPKNRFINLTQRIIFISSIILLPIFLVIMWFLLFLPSFDPLDSGFSSKGVDSMRQLEYMFSYPTFFLETLFNTLWVQKSWLFEMMIGRFGWGEFAIPYWIKWFYLALFVTAILLEGYYSKKSLNLIHRTLFFFLLISVAFSIFCLLYITYTPFGGNEILGVQGRYFIPLIILLLLTIYGVGEQVKFRFKPFVLYALPFLAFSTSVISFYYIIQRYYT